MSCCIINDELSVFSILQVTLRRDGIVDGLQYEGLVYAFMINMTRR